MALSSFPVNALALLFFSATVAFSSAEKQTYIVHMKPSAKPDAYSTHHDWYSATLLTLTGAYDSSSLLYSYSASFPGFAVTLSEAEAESLSQSEAVSTIYKDVLYSLHTTRSAEFLGLESANFERYSGEIDRASHDVIIGVLDTGVWPESKSFDDTGIPKAPPRWKGECESGPDFSPSLCNNKLIGARFFSKGYLAAFGLGLSNKPKEEESPRDRDGHGTHTASTAAGSVVPNASLFGYASGSARGMATHARVASYKVCWGSGCFGSDILAGLDRAIEDGVDVLSLSLGGGSGPYYKDTIAIGAFAAVKRGIFVACSAGNSGPAPASLANVAPWITTVGAGTLDRDFPGYVTLGKWKRNLTGVTLYSGAGIPEPVALVYNNGLDASARLCMPGSLNPNVVRGKVVLCDRGINPRVEKGEVVKIAGGVGMILANTATQGEELVADSHLLPAVAVGRNIGDMIREYARNDSNPTAGLRFGGTVLDVSPSPVVAAFTSRGPNTVTPQILKPDVIGPGVNILAGWADGVGPTGLSNDTRRTRFNILSGTSMSCPHIAGIAALVKAAHPSWTPSAIKSALITTAYDVDNTRAPLRDAASGMDSTPFMHGAGHVNPQKALSPGLVYDVSVSGYVAFMCASGYRLDEVRAVVKISDLNCTETMRSAGNLNYPSFSVVFVKSGAVSYTREVTNVGDGGDVYDVVVNMPDGVEITVRPKKLVFGNVGEKRKYTATFTVRKGAVLKGKHGFGSLVWTNGHQEVKSPIAITWAG